MLAKHQAFSKVAAQGLLRSLAFEALEAARDVDQLRALGPRWRRWIGVTPSLPPRAAQCAAELGAFDDSRGWLKPFFDDLISLPRDAPGTLSLALIPALVGSGLTGFSAWRPPRSALPRDGHLACALGQALFERQLWGKSRQTLESVVDDAEVARRCPPPRPGWPWPRSLSKKATTHAEPIAWTRLRACVEGCCDDSPRLLFGVSKQAILRSFAAVAQLDRTWLKPSSWVRILPAAPEPSEDESQTCERPTRFPLGLWNRSLGRGQWGCHGENRPP